MEKYHTDAACPKCGSQTLSLEYCKHYFVYLRDGSATKQPDTLNVACRTCGYAWSMLPLDHLDS